MVISISVTEIDIRSMRDTTATNSSVFLIKTIDIAQASILARYSFRLEPQYRN